MNRTNRNFNILGRIKYEPVFNTPNQKANLFVGAAPDARPENGTYNLLTFRSEGQFNNIVYEDEDVFRGVKHRNIVFMNQADI